MIIGSKVTANNHDQNRGGGKWIYFAYLQNKRGGHVPTPPVPYTPPAHAWDPYLVYISCNLNQFYSNFVCNFRMLLMCCSQFDKLLEPQVWLDAACQIFFSFSIAFGGIIAMASFNPRKNNCKRDAILMTICNCATGLFVASIIFSILGNKAYETAADCLSECVVSVKVLKSSSAVWGSIITRSKRQAGCQFLHYNIMFFSDLLLSIVDRKSRMGRTEIQYQFSVL